MTKSNTDIEKNITIEVLTKADYGNLNKLFTTVYASSFDELWSFKDIELLLDIFPRGQVCIKLNGEIVACCFSIIITENDYSKFETYNKIIGNYTFSTHTNKGVILYGLEVCVSPNYRGLGLGRKLYHFRKELCETLNLKKIAFGGRMPNYYKFSDIMSPSDYINKVMDKEIYDPVINFQLAFGFKFKGLLSNYIKDKDSKNFATKLEWINVNYKPRKQCV